YSLAASTARQVQNNPAAPCSGLFPLTPALSLGERVNPSLGGERSIHLGLPLRGARCSLSQRERVRVRGNGANAPLAFRTIPGTVELDESSGEYLFSTMVELVALRRVAPRTAAQRYPLGVDRKSTRLNSR